MFEVVLSNRFRKDLKLAAKRGYDLDLLNDIGDVWRGGKRSPPKIGIIP